MAVRIQYTDYKFSPPSKISWAEICLIKAKINQNPLYNYIESQYPIVRVP